jgi:hypothetical protein
LESAPLTIIPQKTEKPYTPNGAEDAEKHEYLSELPDKEAEDQPDGGKGGPEGNQPLDIDPVGQVTHNEGVAGQNQTEQCRGQGEKRKDYNVPTVVQSPGDRCLRRVIIPHRLPDLAHTATSRLFYRGTARAQKEE